MCKYFSLILLIILASCVRKAPEPERQYVHRYGVSIPKHVWEEEGQEGTIVTNLPDGVTLTQTYKYGNLEGETTATFPYSSTIEKIELFSQNKPIKETLFYPSGTSKREKTFNTAENTTTIQTWYENGQIQSIEKMSGELLVSGQYFDTDGHRLSNIEGGSGARLLRDLGGLPQVTEEIEAGKVRYRTTYYPDGLPKEIDPYVNGLVEGQRKTYYPGGVPKTLETWKAGKQQGLTIVYQNGEKFQEIPYVNGMKNGKGRVFKDGTFVVQEPIWKDDFLHGCCITYHEDRKATEWYMKGKKVSRAYYDSFNFKTYIEE